MSNPHLNSRIYKSMFQIILKIMSCFLSFVRLLSLFSLTQVPRGVVG